MTKPLRTTVALVVAMTVLTACGSTRFVVVESGADAGAPEQAAGSTPTSDAPAAPTGEPTRADDAAIRKSVAEALAVDDRPMRKRLPYLEADAEDLVSTYESVRKIVEGFAIKIVVDDIAAAGDEATATVSVTVDGASFASGLPVTLVRSEGKWKVTRDGACTLLALASPCPDRA